MSLVPVTPKWLAWFVRNQRTIQLLFVANGAALLVYSLADWQRWLPFEPGFQPLRMVCISGALTLQAVGSLVMRRSQSLFYVLLGASMVLIVMSFAVAS
jgi:hypothetical protein